VQKSSFSLFCEFESSVVREFKLLWEFGPFFEIFMKFANLQILGSTIAAWGLSVNWSLGGEKIGLYI